MAETGSTNARTEPCESRRISFCLIFEMGQEKYALLNAAATGPSTNRRQNRRTIASGNLTECKELIVEVSGRSSMAVCCRDPQRVACGEELRRWREEQRSSLGSRP